MATTMELSATPSIFGNEVLAHPQSQPQQKAVVLEECAKSLALRLGYGMEDVSFRESVDLILASNNNSYCGETTTAPSISLLVEQDTAPSNRPSSVLRRVYFSSLNALHKIEDPPTKEDPPCVINTPSKRTEQGIHSKEMERDGRLLLQDDKHDNCDRPLTMGPLSRASTTKSSSTHSSWSSVSVSSITNQNDNNNNTNTGSFHFVSQFDDSDSDDETWHGGEETARMMREHNDGETTDCDDDKSMVVFLETGDVEPRNLQESWDCKSSHHKRPTIPQDHRNNSTRIDLPHDFEVVTVVSTHMGGEGEGNDDGDGDSSPLRGRTYSVTTTASACSLQATQKTKTKQGKPSAVQSSGRSQSCGAVITSSSSSSTATNSFSRKVRKLLTLRSKSTGSYAITSL